MAKFLDEEKKKKSCSKPEMKTMKNYSLNLILIVNTIKETSIVKDWERKRFSDYILPSWP